MGADAYEAELVERMARVVGPAVVDRSERDRIRVNGSYRGAPVRIGVSTSENVLCGYDIDVGLAGRPIRLEIHDHRTSIVGLSPLPTGDATFDAAYRVFGYPREVVLEVLEPSFRAWVLATYPKCDPRIETQGSELRVYRSLPGSRQTLETGRPVPEEREIAGWVELTIDLAGRLVGAFERAYARVAAEAGDAAAQAWLSAQVQVAQNQLAARRRFRTILLGAIALAIVLPLLCVLGILVAGLLGAWHGAVTFG